MKFRRQRLEEVNINLTPLIDVVFLLLIFFMVSTTFKQTTDLTIDLPTANSGAVSIVSQDPVEVTISKDGQFVINGQTLINERIDTLVQGLQQSFEGNLDRPLIITAHVHPRERYQERVKHVSKLTERLLSAPCVPT